MHAPRHIIIFIFCGSLTMAAAGLIKNGLFVDWENGIPRTWQFVTQRPEVTPSLTRNDQDGKTWASFECREDGLSMGSLVQSVNIDATADTWLHFSAAVRLRGNLNPVEHVLIDLQWQQKPLPEGGWQPSVRHFIPLTPAPGVQDRYTARLEFPVAPRAQGLTVKLMQMGGSSGSVAFTDVQLSAIPAPPPRTVKLASAYYMPQGHTDWAANLAGIENLTKEAAGKGCDLILFGEGVSVVGSGKTYYDIAEPIPGPCSNDLAKIADRHSIFLVAGLYEKDGTAAYNTAVMFDRSGKLVGKYRKVHLPLPEIEGGLQPGNTFPVFDTELGKIGIQICYDHHFQESARCLAVQGAEIILTPIWGDMRSDGECYDAVARSRALDNGVFYVMSAYSLARSLIVDPHGRIVASTSGKKEPNLAIADLDLRQIYRTDHGYRVPPNIQQGFRQERRPGAYNALVEK